MKIQINRILLLFTILILITSCNSQITKQTNAINKNKVINSHKIDSLMKATFKRGFFNGSILVVKNDSIIYKNSIGFTDASKTNKLKPNMVFNIGSISKELSAVSIMMLVEEGKISLDDKISKFDLGLPNWVDKIKVSNLLNYSSGLPKYNWDKVRTNKDVYSDLKSIDSLKFEPGTDFLYSNNNVFIRRLIIEQVSGMPFNKFIKKRILTPLKMENTFLSPANETSQFATAFNNKGENYIEIYQMDGGTYTTPNDLYKWIQGLYTERIISTKSINILGTPLAHKNANQSSLGFTTLENATISRHQASGSNVDYETIVDYNLENGVTTILMTNNANYKLWELNRQINAILDNRKFYIPNNSIKDTIREKCKNNINEGIAYYKELKNRDVEAYNFENSNELNSLGYEFLNQNKVKEAIEIFKLLVSEFPNLANPYDSLGEAYFNDDNLELALVNYQKALDLNPDNSNAAKWIDKIKYPTIDTTKFNKVYPKQQYIDDIETLANTLTTRNPHPYRYMSKGDFWKVVEGKKDLINDNTTFSDFIWHCSEIVANLNCGHSGLGYFNQESTMLPIELRFPLEVKLIEDKLYVSDALSNKDKIEAGKEIIAINGKNISELKNDIYKHIKSQAKVESFKRLLFNGYSTAYIPYSLGFPEAYEVLLAGNDIPVKLNRITHYKSKPRINPGNKCQDNLCLDIIDETNTAVMTIRSFAYYGNKFPTYKKFIDDSFKKVHSKGLKNLILDVRMNGGGPSDAGIYLLRYLTQGPFVYFKSSAFNEKNMSYKPFEKRFKGKVCIIIDGDGGSTTGHFMSLVKHLNLATIVGEELGSNQFCTGGQISFRLPNTEIFYAVGRYTYITTANSFSDERGVMPDHYVTQSIIDYLNNVDTVMEYTKALINR